MAEHELTDHYCLGDVFIMANRALPDGETEGFGLVFLEANACGLPVIAGRAGGSVDAVTDMVNGLGGRWGRYRGDRGRSDPDVPGR